MFGSNRYPIDVLINNLENQTQCDTLNFRNIVSGNIQFKRKLEREDIWSIDDDVAYSRE